MASTNHTPNLNLNQWAENDQVLREDFNADNTKLDAAFASLSSTEIGTYAGDGAETRTITLSKTPLAVLVMQSGTSLYTGSYCYGGLALPDNPVNAVDSMQNRHPAVSVITGGFQVGYHTSHRISTNSQGSVYHYIAFL